MSGTLPPNLINTATSEVNTTDDIDLEITNSQILHRFWKVHAIQSDYVQDAASARARNLFWRVWSSPHLSRSITSPTLHSLFQQFAGHVDLSPIHIDPNFWKKHEQKPDVSQSTSTPGDDPQPTDHESPIRDRGQSTPGTAELTSSYSEATQLRLERSGQNNSIGGKRNNDGSSSTSNTTSDSSSRPSLMRNTSGSKGRVPTVAANNKGKQKPVLARRKSSQSKVQQANPPRSPRPIIKSPQKESLQESNSNRIKIQAPPGLASAIARNSGPIFALPSASSWEDEPTLGKSAPSEPASDPNASLVEGNFRERFVENQRQMNSSTNLPALSRMAKTGSVVRFADEVVDDVRKGKEKEQPPDSSNSNPRRRSSLGNEAVLDESDSDELTLPRTRSSLSLMITDMRKQSGSQTLRPEPLAKEAQSRAREARKKEEELLTMGRKAGAPSIHKVGSNDEHQYRPPSPGPIF